MIDFVAAVASESQRFATTVDRALATSVAPADIAVPSCPDWDLPDLIWHLSEVQHFWASIVEANLDDPAAVPRFERPPVDGLPALFERCSLRLVDALAGHDPDEACWSWYDEGHTVGWVRRRQAHEALIHRLDAELALAAVATGVESEPIDEALAADGIDEMLTVMLEARSLPEWARWESDGGQIRIEVPERNWRLVTGRVVGTDPDGEARALPAVRLIEDGAGSGDAESAVLRGPASIIDRWLWRRGTLDGPGIEVDGDRAVLDRLRDLADVD